MMGSKHFMINLVERWSSMHKVILTLALSFMCLFANEATKEKFQILAKKVNSKDNIVIATGNVVIFSPNYYILANKAIYDKNKETFELFDDVIVLQNNEVLTQSNYAFLDITKEEIYQNPIFVVSSQSNVWITSKELEQEQNLYIFENSILSSCDCTDPAWSIRFSDGKYNKQEQWIDTFNTRLYIKDVPIFYTPYFGFSTDKTRRTGLLTPTVGYSSSEGFIYGQPIFIAPAPNYDIELAPEIRTSRGYGMYAYYRWADSPYSMLKLRTGYWKEKSDYYKKESLENQKHYGYNIDYRRTKLFSKNKEDEDGLLVDINWLNDVEFRNIRTDQEPNNKKVESKINYYFDAPQYYLGTYFRYYLDTSVTSNKETLQQLPQIQLHSYSQPLLFDKITYATDFKFTEEYREDGLNVNRYELLVPLSYSFSMFDDFLTLTFKEELTAIQQNYTNSSTNFENATFFENRHIIALSTDLVKQYESVLHTMNLEGNITLPNQFGIQGDIYGITSTNSDLNDFPITETSKSLTLSLNQSLYDNEDLKQIVNHKLSQAIIYDELDNSKLGNMENEIRLNYLYGSLSNRLIYSHLDNELIESSSSFNFDYFDYYIKLSYYMSQNTPNSGKKDLESYTVDLGYTFLRDYKISYYEKYNIQENLRNKQGIIFNIDDKCWSVNLKYEKEIKASSSTTARTIEQDILYFELVLKPLGQINQNYTINDNRRN